MNDDKLMELLDLAAEQYAPPPGKQVAVLNRIIKKQTVHSQMQPQTSALLENAFCLFSKLMQTLDTAESENQIKTQ